jgi:hypothetical protein
MIAELTNRDVREAVSTSNAVTESELISADLKKPISVVKDETLIELANPESVKRDS